MEQAHVNDKTQGLSSWTTRDVMILAAIVIGLAVLSIISSYFRTILEAGFGPYGNRIVAIVNIVVVFTVPYLIRKPLAAILGAVLLGITQVPFSPVGPVALVGFLVGGIIAELIFATGRYRNYSLRFLLMGGLAYNAITLFFIWVPLQIGSLSAVGIIGIFVATIVGGLLGGWITVIIGDGLATSGVLRGYLGEVEEI